VHHEGSQSLKGLSISSLEIRMEMENKKEETKQRIRPCNQADGRKRLNITVKQEASQENGSPTRHIHLTTFRIPPSQSNQQKGNKFIS